MQVPAQIVDFRPKADRSYKITFETRELSGHDVALLADNFQGEGWMLFRPNGDISSEEVPKTVADSGTKTPSQRLRAIIYLLYKQKGGKSSFDAYYHTSIEKLIDLIREELDE